ncbi:MAG: transcriptional regulator PpsR [Hyphomicrobium sp.]|nr:transcriptional regulator PpsR [Hyphomicrobium sp.]
MAPRGLQNSADNFRAPKKTLGSLDADAAARLIAAAGDIALIIDKKGVIRDVAFADSDLAKHGFDDWLGQRWEDVVTSESRVKVEDLIKHASSSATPRWRQVNHPSPRGSDIPVQYCAVEVGDDGRIVAVGRDLRTLASLQQRLVDTQQTIEREYARVRHSETRYRLLFQITSEPVLIVDGMSSLVIEANASASRVLGKPVKKLSGRSFPELFDSESVKKVQENIASVRAAGRADPVTAKLADSKAEVVVSASAFRQDGSLLLLVRMVSSSQDVSAGSRTRLFDVVQKLPDGFVVTDLDCNILSANDAFLELIQAGSLEQVLSQKLGKWVGRHAMEFSVLVTNLREHGTVRHFFTLLRGEFDSSEEVEISAVAVTSGEQPCLGFTVRGVSRRPDILVNGRRELPRSVEQLTQLVGRVALRDLVRESTDVIERLCIEAALELTGDNRASAADMLGLSRQSLYSKLRRHGLGDLDSDVGV